MDEIWVIICMPSQFEDRLRDRIKLAKSDFPSNKTLLKVISESNNPTVIHYVGITWDKSEFDDDY